MEEERLPAALLNYESPVAWTFPAGVVMLTATFIGLIVFVFYPRTLPPACEMQLRTMLTLAAPAGVGLAATAIVWTAVTNLFPSFC